ncbi:ABC transporter permease [Carboxydochorda subterranea]|uniref:ABC transporter permease n=1 Tax=Carboxydichorda subterranea TaxID=3109565 RepID=A0ABZ1BWV0_9FIRM|nr:ABC transporter permease [Limnochorda sp. L945t]WRP17289.1 ABC transporter permease [Limnochorda sp. L945t]
MRLLAITVVVFVTMSLVRPDRFFTPDNFSSMAFQFPEFGLLAIAMMITMLTGGIDLSIVGIANLSGILAALTLTRLMPPDAAGIQVVLYSLLAVAISLVTGIACGLFNGFLIGYVGIVPILATLGTMQLYTGIAIVITQGAAVYGFPDIITFLGNGSLWIFPVPFLIFGAFALAFSLLLNKTSYGFKLYLMGTNPTAARFSGIDNTLMLLKTYMLSGLMAAVAGFVVLARTNSAKADYGSSYTLQAILIAVLGGVNPSGGFGTVLGLVLAILTLQFLSSGFNMLRFSNFFKEFIWGAVLLVVMVVNYVSNTRSNREQARRRREAERQADVARGAESSVWRPGAQD